MNFIGSKSQLTAGTIEIPEGLYDYLFLSCYGTTTAACALNEIGNIRLDIGGDPYVNADYENLSKISNLYKGLPETTSGAAAYAFSVLILLTLPGSENSVYISDADNAILRYGANLEATIATANIDVWGIQGSYPTRYILGTIDETKGLGGKKPLRVQMPNVVCMMFNPATTTDPTNILVTKDGIVKDDIDFVRGIQLSDLMGEVELASVGVVHTDLAPRRLISECFARKVQASFTGGAGNLTTTILQANFDRTRFDMSRAYIERLHSLNGVERDLLPVSELPPEAALRTQPTQSGRVPTLQPRRSVFSRY